MAHLSGRHCFITVATSLLEGITDSSFDEYVDFLEATTNDSDGHREGLAGEDGFEVSVNILSNSAHTYGITEVRTAKAAKVAVAVVWGPGVDTAGERILSGNAIITGITENAEKNTVMSASIKFTGTAALTEGTTSTTAT